MTTIKPALLMVAHGSRRPAANAEFLQQVEQVAKASKDTYQTVAGAFLELTQPGIVEGLSQLAQAGHNEIFVLPCFLNRGRHVAEDVPEDIAEFCQAHPTIRVTTLPYIGSQASYVELLATQATLGLANN